MRRGRSSQLRPRSFSERGRFAFRFRPRAERRLGAEGLIASDVVAELPHALAALTRPRNPA